MLIISLLLSGCSRTKQLARAPVTDVPSVDYQGPAPEVENQTTSAPIMVDRLPEPTSTAAEAPPNLAPPAQRTPASRQPRIAVESRKEVKPVSPPPAETRPVAQVPPIQLLPQFSESDKTALYKKINDQLESARSVLRSIDESQLTEQEKPNLAAVVDFIKKSEDALKHGQFYQGLVLAQKANTLAASLARNP
jgi:hypothetical protein